MIEIEIEIYLKSGAHLSIFVDEFTVKKNVLTGDFSGLAWKSSANELPHLLHIDIGEIAAIVSTHKAAQPALAGGLAPAQASTSQNLSTPTQRVPDAATA